MSNYLLPLLLLLVASVSSLAAPTELFAQGGAVESYGYLSHTNIDEHDLAANFTEQDSAPPQDSASPQESRAQLQCIHREGEHFVSASEKFDSSFCESIVLHLVAKTNGKLLLDDLVEKVPGSPSLLRLNVMLQV